MPSYATPQNVIARYDIRRLSQFLSDTGSPVCTQAQADAMLDADIASAEAAACRVLGDESWALLNEPRQGALTDMAYEMGASGLAGFKVSLSLIRLGDFDAASTNMLLSAWAKEVPRRAWEDALIIRTGEFPLK